MKAYEDIVAVEFNSGPSPELLEEMRRHERAAQELCAFEWSTEELRGFGELCPQQVDRLLSR